MNNNQNMNGFNQVQNQTNTNQPMNSINQNMNYQPMYGMPNQGMNPQQMNNMPNQMGPMPMNNKKNNSLLIAIPIVIIVAAIVIILMNTGSNYKTPIKQFCKGMNDLDFNEISKAFPEDIATSSNFKYLSSIIEDEKEEIANGTTWSVTCDIKDGQKMEESKLKELSDDYKENINSDKEITDGYTVDVKMKYNAKSSDGKTDSDESEMTFYVGKINGKWYVIYYE